MNFTSNEMTKIGTNDPKLAKAIEHSNAIECLKALYEIGGIDTKTYANALGAILKEIDI